MALSNAERQKLFRQRKREGKLKGKEHLDTHMSKPFSEWLTDTDWSDITGDLDWTGSRAADEFPGANDTDPYWEPIDGPNRGSIGCAERMVSTFLDAAVTMADKINKYKTDQVNARIAEIEAADLTDPAIKKQALADIAKLTRYRDELSKSVRWTLPAWKVTGE